MDAGGILWLIIDVVLVAALGAALVYGTMHYRNRRGGPRAPEYDER